MNKFDLKPGETLRVGERYVFVHSKTEKMYRYYGLNGNYIGSFSEEQIQSNPDENCIFGKDCIWMRKDGSWVVLNYKARIICDYSIKNVKISEDRKYVVIILNDYEAEIWSINGELLLQRDFYKNVVIYGKYAVLEIANYTKVFDLEKGEFDGDFYITAEFSLDEFLNAHSKQEEDTEKKAVNEENEQEYSLTLFNNVQVGTNDVLWFCEKYFAVCKRTWNIGEKTCYGKFVAKCYTLDGKFIENTGIIYDADGKVSDFKRIETDTILALRGSEKNWLMTKSKAWKLFDYSGKKIANKFFDWLFVDKSNKYLVCGIFGISPDNPSLICVFSIKEGELISEWYGFKTIVAIGEGYYVLKDFDQNNWIYNENGELIFTAPISDPIYCMDDLIIKKIIYGYDVYDCLHEKVDLIKAIEINIELKKGNRKVILFTYAKKTGVYAYDTDKGFYEIVPMKYEKVEVSGNIICAQNFLEDATEDIYDLDGKLISSTSK